MNAHPPCLVCGFPLIWSDSAPGPSEFRCKVCELKTEIELINESLIRQHDLLITAFETLIYMGYPIDEFPGMEPHLLKQAWKQVRDHESYT